MGLGDEVQRVLKTDHQTAQIPVETGLVALRNLYFFMTASWWDSGGWVGLRISGGKVLHYILESQGGGGSIVWTPRILIWLA